MVDRAKTPASFTVGMVLLFVPVALGLLSASEMLPQMAWVQVSVVLIIIGCVGGGSYLVFWGRRPSKNRGDWIPSQTLPKKDDGE